MTREQALKSIESALDRATDDQLIALNESLMFRLHRSKPFQYMIDADCTYIGQGNWLEADFICLSYGGPAPVLYIGQRDKKDKTRSNEIRMTHKQAFELKEMLNKNIHHE